MLVPDGDHGTGWQTAIVGFRDTLREWFGASEEVDPDEPTEIGVVSVAVGQIALTCLREEGFDAVGHDAFNIVSNVSSGYRILVPHAQSEAAAARLDEILTT
jgi:hypothetical protein